MKSNNTLHIILFLVLAEFSYGQDVDRKEILGEIFEGSVSIEGVNVINANSQIAKVSDRNGMFSIPVKKGDVLVFSAVSLDSLKREITTEDLKVGKLFVKMVVNKIELKEVVVNTGITAENLGIVPHGQKTFTPAERKLATAGDFKPVHLLGLLGGSFELDPLLNKINGRTKKLKELVEIERKEMNIVQLGYLFEDAYFTDYLKIPSEYVLGFKFYFVESQDVSLLLTEKDKTKLTPLLAESALKYNEIISGETK
ncbi:carboxypeptidase-like regulatory domain-containing protein [Flavobacterium denitrificans]|uniref:carboxypeptidase-like regulatory domain-containing protein n=1 Tax=Flavobacterium denitrificans TaxID=281361 RepID=UPI00047BA1C4|nr:carboxypeptidase-like regulatory domain-containing protein [Flavobacterium denitrificans]